MSKVLFTRKRQSNQHAGEDMAARFGEYAAPIANKGKIRTKRALLITAYILFAAGYALTFVALMIPTVIAVLPIFVWMLVYFTWRFVSYECRVSVEAGEVTVSRLYSKKEAVLLQCKAKDLVAVAPYTEAHLGKLEAYAPESTLDHRADPDADNAYFAVIRTDGGYQALLFQATDKLLSTLAYYNKSAVTVK